MDLGLKGNMKMGKKMVKAFIFGVMAPNMKENGLIIKSKDKFLFLFDLKKNCFKLRVLIHGQMVESILEHG